MTTVKNLAVANHQPILHNFTYLIAIEVPIGNLTYLHKMPQYTFHNGILVVRGGNYSAPNINSDSGLGSEQ